MTHHNNKPSKKESILERKDALKKTKGHLEELHGLVRELNHHGWKKLQTGRLRNRILILVQDVATLTPHFQDELSQEAQKDLEILAKSFEDYSADGELHRESWAKEFEARRDLVDKSLLNLLSELNVA